MTMNSSSGQRSPRRRSSGSVRRSRTSSGSYSSVGSRTSASGAGTGYGSGGYRGAYKTGRKKNNGKAVYLLIGIIAVAALAGLLFYFKKIRKNPAAGETTPAETENISRALPGAGAVRRHALVDISALLPEKDRTSEAASMDLYGMTPEEVGSQLRSKYNWSMKVVHRDANVGEVVAPTVDANETTAPAVMGEGEHPDLVTETETTAAAAAENTKKTENPEKTENPDAVPGDEQGETVEDGIVITDVIEVPDLVADRIDELVEKIREDSSLYEDTGILGGLTGSQENPSYVLSLEGTDKDIEDVVEYAHTMWYVQSKGGNIGSYDAETDTFLMEGAADGFDPDENGLRQAIRSALEAGNFSAEIPLTGEVLKRDEEADLSQYVILAEFQTHTTANSVRNKNIALACEKLNGYILKAGEELSYNEVVGRRTEAAGYGAAAAYVNGEVIQEIGGGVCQVSSTLYNAVLKAGLKTTERRSHTFQPTYVTPGEDATVSWGGPEYKFANVPAIPEYSYPESYTIGIRAVYKDRTVTVSIYGRPVLLEGYTYELSSVCTKEKEIVRVPIEPGSERQPETGTKGSVWKTTLIIKKDGEVVEKRHDHDSYYTGHTEYYLMEPETGADGASTIMDAPDALTEETTANNAPVGPGMPGAETYAASQNPNSGAPPAEGGSPSAPGGENGPGPGSENVISDPASQQMPGGGGPG